jgi:hypothetical protein
VFLKLVARILMVAAMVVSVMRVEADETSCTITYDHDRLTVHAQGAPLADVVRELGRRSGAEVLGDVRKPRDVNQDFDDVPLVDGLVRLLGEQNFTLRYGRAGDLRAIDLLGEPLRAAPDASAMAEAGAPKGEVTALGGRDRGGMRASRVTLPDGQVVVTVTGTEADGHGRKHHHEGASDPSMLLGTLSSQPASAQDQTNQDNTPLTPDELERKMRRSLLNALGQMDDATLAQFLGTPEGQKVEALLQYYASHHPSSSFNQRANGLLDRIPSRGAPAAHGHR